MAPCSIPLIADHNIVVDLYVLERNLTLGLGIDSEVVLFKRLLMVNHSRYFLLGEARLDQQRLT